MPKEIEYTLEGTSIRGYGRTKTLARANMEKKAAEAIQTADNWPMVIEYAGNMAIIFSSPWGFWWDILEPVDPGHTVKRYYAEQKHTADNWKDAEKDARNDLAWRAYDWAQDDGTDNEIPAVLIEPNAQLEFCRMREWQRHARRFYDWAIAEGFDKSKAMQWLHPYACYAQSITQYIFKDDEPISPADWYQKEQEAQK